MRYRELHEAPIELNVVGHDEPASFRADDLALVNNPKARAKIDRIWHNSVANVVVYMFNYTANDLSAALTFAIQNSRFLPKTSPSSSPRTKVINGYR